jgi:hypothetical protein
MEDGDPPEVAFKWSKWGPKLLPLLITALILAVILGTALP